MITPTTDQINQQIISQLEASLGQTIPFLPKMFLRVLSWVLAGVFVLLYKYGGFIFLQIFVKYATLDSTEINGRVIRPLLEWGRLFGVTDPIAAVQAEHEIEITVQNQTGSILAGTQLLNAGNGVTYITIGATLLDGATVTATIRAASDQSGNGGAGVIGNLEDGAIVTFANPLPNVARDAVVTSQTVTGVDAETTESYRQRIIDYVQKRPQGGAYADYENWAFDVAGIVNVYPYTGVPGEVDVYVEATPESSGDPDGIPTGAQLTAVLNAINLDVSGKASRRPVGTYVNVLPITRTGFDVVVSGLAVDNEAQVIADIESAVQEFFLAAEPFIDGLTIPPRNDIITRTALSSVVQFIVSQAGGTFTDTIFRETGQVGNLDSYILSEGEKAKAVNIDIA